MTRSDTDSTQPTMPGGFSDTTFRLVLLVLTCVTASIFLWDFIAVYFLGDEAIANLGRCRDLEISRQPGQTISLHAACWAPYYLKLAWLTLLGVSATVLVSGLIFLGMPRILAARRGLVPLGDRFGPAVELIGAVAARTGSRPLRVLLDRAQAQPTARVIRGFGRPTLVVSFGMLPLSTRRPQAFGAVIAHELAHIENHDARKTEAALSAWWGLVTASLVPYTAAALLATVTALSAGGVVTRGGIDLGVVPWSSLVKIAVVTLLAFLIRNALLRAREFAADSYAAERLDARVDLRVLFAAVKEAERRLWHRLLSVHPPATSRLARLEDARLGAAVSPWETFTLGLLAHLSVAALAIPLSYIAHGRFEASYLVPLASVGVGAILGLGLWALLWRGCVAGVSTVRDDLLAGATLGLGALASSVLTPLPVEVEPIWALATSSVNVVTALVQVGGWMLFALFVGGLVRRWARRSALITQTSAFRALVAGGIAAGAAAAACFLAIAPFTLLAAAFAEQGLTVSDLLIVGTAATVDNPYFWSSCVLVVAAVVVGRIVLGRGVPHPPDAAPR